MTVQLSGVLSFCSIGKGECVTVEVFTCVISQCFQFSLFSFFHHVIGCTSVGEYSNMQAQHNIGRVSTSA